MASPTGIHQVVLIPGDGIGPEVTEAVRRIFEAAGAPVQWIEHSAGLAALKQGQPLLSDETLEAIQRHRIALKGPCTTPVGEGFMFDQCHSAKAIEPLRCRPAGPEPRGRADPVPWSGPDHRPREYRGALQRRREPGYSGRRDEHEGRDRSGMHAHFPLGIPFRHAEAASKDHGVPQGQHHEDDRWSAAALRRKVHDEEYPNIEYQELIIDAGCMKLVQDPSQFDVLLLENLYGDMVSDLSAGLVGGLGVVPGANIGDDLAVFEAVHGSAPDIAGKDIVNPLAFLMSGVMLLNHLAETRSDSRCHLIAERIKAGYDLRAGGESKDPRSRRQSRHPGVRRCRHPEIARRIISAHFNAIGHLPSTADLHGGVLCLLLRKVGGALPP